MHIGRLLAAGVAALAFWPGPAVPQPGTSSQLSAVACTSSANCWAVGSYALSAQVTVNEMLRWNGSAWSKVAVPSPGGTSAGAFSGLAAVRCASASDCWAVGGYRKGSGATLSEALHWNGRKWFAVPVPQPAGTITGDYDALFDVACVSSKACWAVGRYGTISGGTVLLNLVLNWNGTRWGMAGVPDPAGTNHGDINELFAVRCVSAASCLAVGSDGTLSSPFVLENEVLRWNGKKWAQVGVPSPGGHASDGSFSTLSGLACTSGTNCWAVGTFGRFSAPERFIDQVLHWNGTGWSVVTGPEPAGVGSGAVQRLAYVACGSTTDCWAVGSYARPKDKTIVLNQAQHWDGGVWSLVRTPDPGGVMPGNGNGLSALRCLSHSNCWAVGAANRPRQPGRNQVLHWNGTRWFAR